MAGVEVFLICEFKVLFLIPFIPASRKNPLLLVVSISYGLTFVYSDSFLKSLNIGDFIYPPTLIRLKGWLIINTIGNNIKIKTIHQIISIVFILIIKP
jgi:hypothetical protein